jgi:putative transposase
MPGQLKSRAQCALVSTRSRPTVIIVWALQAYGLRPSMSGKGNCYDNALVETFFKSLKAEMIWRQKWQTRRQAETVILQYINGFYNTRRPHSYLGGISPVAFETKVA